MKSIITTILKPIPDIKQLGKWLHIKEKHRMNITIGLLLTMIVVALMMPYLINETYNSARLVTYISRIILFLILLIITKELSQYSGSIISGFALIAAIYQLLLIISLIFPINWVTNAINLTNKSAQQNVIYITYDDTCEYCKIANTNMRKAVEVYNASHIKRVEVVDLNNKNKLSTDLEKAIEYKGTIIEFKKDDTQVAIYTLGNDNGPVKPTASYIYDILKTYK